jgi:hypothetical protein
MEQDTGPGYRSSGFQLARIHGDLAAEVIHHVICGLAKAQPVDMAPRGEVQKAVLEEGEQASNLQLFYIRTNVSDNAATVLKPTSSHPFFFTWLLFCGLQTTALGCGVIWTVRNEESCLKNP